MSHHDKRRRAPAAARNRGPVLDVLRRVLPANAHVLEIASGSGEHAVSFARALAGMIWRPSDPDHDARESIAAWIESEGLTNVTAPLDLDVCAANWAAALAPVDALVSLNMIHIAPWDAALGLMDGAGRIVRGGGLLFLYGPFKRGGAHTAPSNEVFDASLRARDSSWGVRDLEAVEAIAAAQGFQLQEVVEMPANNLSLVFVKAQGAG